MQKPYICAHDGLKVAEVTSVLHEAMRRCEHIMLTSRQTVASHSLWCAQQAVNAECDAAMIVSAMFHDIGHYILAGDPEISDYDRDAEHAELGAAWLARWFPEEVYAPIAMHVKAKRYLATIKPDYVVLLCAGSLQSFESQGGIMNEDELKNFENEKYFGQAIQLRYFDDQPYKGQKINPYIWYEELISLVLGQV
ncbi:MULTISPECIES: phosphodiesterase [Pseudomonas]|uniref:Phosphodiesterase n=1 Tax=Pseudomonas quercus TaxID=2722792 RepID=A0ABX0YFU1_9PSED|nr:MULTISPECIES: phosphodiesterase [Pseudomonas]MBF7142531.1 phosphodiesterase [Pseudomonas sp. LY10J]NJP01069.1 phosphodiesterase [Pseudomonas quercus]